MFREGQRLIARNDLSESFRVHGGDRLAYDGMIKFGVVVNPGEITKSTMSVTFTYIGGGQGRYLVCPEDFKSERKPAIILEG